MSELPELADLPIAEVVFDGEALQCPVCFGELSQLALVLDLEGAEPLHCDGCGAVLAA